MSKVKKHPKFHFDKIKDFDKIVPDKEIDEVLNNEFLEVLNTLKNPRSKISKHLKKYFIIRLVTVVESHLKYLVAHLIDEHGMKINRLFSEGTVTLQLNDLENIRKKEFTIGKMTAISFNLQNMNETNYVLSNLLGINFIETLVEYGKIAIKNNILVKEDVEHFQSHKKDFCQMFSLRNEIIHSMITPHKIRRKPEYFETLWDVSYHFLNLTFNLAESLAEFKEGKLKEKELQIFFSKKIKHYKQK